eukprot:347157-Chlamydomonas_euryale.AAC.1
MGSSTVVLLCLVLCLSAAHGHVRLLLSESEARLTDCGEHKPAACYPGITPLSCEARGCTYDTENNGPWCWGDSSPAKSVECGEFQPAT